VNTVPEAGLLNKNSIKLSCSFRRNQNNSSLCCESGHTLLCYLSRTWMFNKPTPVTQLRSVFWGFYF